MVTTVRNLWPDVLAGLLVAIAFLIGVVIAYRRGFRAALPLQVETFDFLAAQLQLDGSRWRIAVHAEDADQFPAEVELQQAGSRLTGQGARPDGTRVQLEGVIHRRRVECLVCRSREETTAPEVWMLDADAADQLLTGYWIGWHRAGFQLLVRELKLHRISVPREDAVSGEQTVGIAASSSPQTPA